MLPSSRFALSLKPNVAYLVLNFAAAWKKQTTFPSLAYAGIPYQSLGVRPGALSLMIAWSCLAMVRSGSRISAIFASTTLSPSPLPAFISCTRSLIAPRSSSVNALLVTVVLLVDCFVPFCAGFMEFDSSFQTLSVFSRGHSKRCNQLRWALVAGTARNRKSQHSQWDSNPLPFDPPFRPILNTSFSYKNPNFSNHPPTGILN